jgi:hypothetical protein
LVPLPVTEAASPHGVSIHREKGESKLNKKSLRTNISAIHSSSKNTRLPTFSFLIDTNGSSDTTSSSRARGSAASGKREKSAAMGDEDGPSSVVVAEVYVESDDVVLAGVAPEWEY